MAQFTDNDPFNNYDGISRYSGFAPSSKDYIGVFPLAGYAYGHDIGDNLHLPIMLPETLGVATALLFLASGLWLLGGSRGPFLVRLLLGLAGLVWFAVVVGAVFYWFHGPYVIGTYHVG